MIRDILRNKPHYPSTLSEEARVRGQGLLAKPSQGLTRVEALPGACMYRMCNPGPGWAAVGRLTERPCPHVLS